MRCRPKGWVDGWGRDIIMATHRAGRGTWVGWLVNLHGVTWVLAFDGSEYPVTVRSEDGKFDTCNSIFPGEGNCVTEGSL